MISLDDIEDMPALNRAEIDARAEHEYVTEFDTAPLRQLHDACASWTTKSAPDNL
jgi:hypothetical protein